MKNKKSAPYQTMNTSQAKSKSKREIYNYWHSDIVVIIAQIHNVAKVQIIAMNVPTCQLI